MPSGLTRGWTPVRVKKTRQIKNLELRFDSIETEKALVAIVIPIGLPAALPRERNPRIDVAVNRAPGRSRLALGIGLVGAVAGSPDAAALDAPHRIAHVLASFA
jgi:hypothetical protein